MLKKMHNIRARLVAVNGAVTGALHQLPSLRKYRLVKALVEIPTSASGDFSAFVCVTDSAPAAAKVIDDGGVLARASVLVYVTGAAGATTMNRILNLQNISNDVVGGAQSPTNIGVGIYQATGGNITCSYVLEFEELD